MLATKKSCFFFCHTNSLCVCIVDTHTLSLSIFGRVSPTAAAATKFSSGKAQIYQSKQVSQPFTFYIQNTAATAEHIIRIGSQQASKTANKNIIQAPFVNLVQNICFFYIESIHHTIHSFIHSVSQSVSQSFNFNSAKTKQKKSPQQSYQISIGSYFTYNIFTENFQKNPKLQIAKILNHFYLSLCLFCVFSLCNDLI